MRQAILTVDLGFGDAGKGSTVDYLVREHQAHTVVRYNGGAQAAHRVVTSDAEHVFAQFGSGTLVPGVETYLSEHVVVHPRALVNEAYALTELGVFDALERLAIHENALVVTPYHQAANQIRELARGDLRHGSCGMGIGETRGDALTFDPREGHIMQARHLREPELAREIGERIRVRKLREIEHLLYNLPDTEETDILYDVFHRAYIVPTEMAHIRIVDDSHWTAIKERTGTIVFEGAQGVLLDEKHGMAPHNTWTNTTLDHARPMLESYAGKITALGITRAYSTRHGPGPFPSYDRELTEQLPDPNNGFGPWQREFRVGPLDLVLMRYAMRYVALDGLALTCLDRVEYPLRVVTGYQNGQWTGPEVPHLSGRELTDFVSECTPSYTWLTNIDQLWEKLEETTGTPIRVVSFGPKAQHKAPVVEAL